MNTTTDIQPTLDGLIAGLKHPQAYPHSIESPVLVHETHLSVVLLAGEFAYKIKKPIQTDFLDYSTLALRRHFCEEELRLDRRFAKGLYIGVVPITLSGDRPTIEGKGDVIEYAVKMHRFSSSALLSERVQAGQLTTKEVVQLASTIAGFHHDAAVCRDRIAEQWPEFLQANIPQTIEQVLTTADASTAATCEVLRDWTTEFQAQHQRLLADRIAAGFIRECHGDLHSANVVCWQGQLVPFDGIEFNDHLRWIDVLSDAAFLAMDLAARDHLDLSRTFLNAYLECTGDYQSLELLRLFLVYRALVRALAASMRKDAEDARHHVDLAYRFTLRETPRLWITHGVSGSGKTTLSEAVVQRHNAFRLRSDVERKRMFGQSARQRLNADNLGFESTGQPDPGQPDTGPPHTGPPNPASQDTATPNRETLYSPEANEQTYQRLSQLARRILASGHSVIVDATFLRRADRQRFYELAEQAGVPIAILDCHSDLQTLRQRVADRMAHRHDASDADLDVLDRQLAHREPLTDAERTLVVEIPDLAQVAESL
ncbi:bifunctional aminoglycoside phosphotransferase/ATP-binding protein [Rhodopirellula sp. P2]|uniref:bifunctional aminoglycoside phosphotransferase/ATP-binding protein n=1 Tax=Rhodopirellula sp. P2 TaxID=2127060 RepID=UPI002368600A|nr:bifunctional aminoglycoside phosphotransferase/ATP-binding protein [Rhodopirellula sp. P2]WDQ14847.1 AAA family ATPase [Rhodopirellula sp. P2]